MIEIKRGKTSVEKNILYKTNWLNAMAVYAGRLVAVHKNTYYL